MTVLEQIIVHYLLRARFSSWNLWIILFLFDSVRLEPGYICEFRFRVKFDRKIPFKPTRTSDVDEREITLSGARWCWVSESSVLDVFSAVKFCDPTLFVSQPKVADIRFSQFREILILRQNFQFERTNAQNSKSEGCRRSRFALYASRFVFEASCRSWLVKLVGQYLSLVLSGRWLSHDSCQFCVLVGLRLLPSLKCSARLESRLKIIPPSLILHLSMDAIDANATVFHLMVLLFSKHWTVKSSGQHCFLLVACRCTGPQVLVSTPEPSGRDSQN